MTLWYFLLYLAGAICFVIALVGRPKWNFMAVGLLAWILVPLIQTVRAL